MQKENNQKLNTSYFFISLGVLVSLVTSVVSFLNLAFAVLDKKFPDVLNSFYQYGYNSYSFENARGALATLIVAFPVLCVLTYFWNKKKDEDLLEYDKVVKNWMVYVLIFLAVLVVLIDLIVLVRYFVSGEITLRFVLKVLSVLLVADIVLAYFLPEVKKFKWEKFAKKYSIIASIIFFVFIVVFSFTVIGSPKTQRDLRIDDRRVSDLQSIQWQVISYWQQKEKLPESLKDLSSPLSGFYLPVDPEFQKGRVYEYNKKGDLIFELCAEFSLPMPQGWQEMGGREVFPMYGKDIAVSSPGVSGMNDSWDHKAGRTCFERTIDKDMYPPYPKN
jgi:hypothetical protein